MSYKVDSARFYLLLLVDSAIVGGDPQAELSRADERDDEPQCSTG